MNVIRKFVTRISNATKRVSTGIASALKFVGGCIALFGWGMLFLWIYQYIQFELNDPAFNVSKVSPTRIVEGTTEEGVPYREEVPLPPVYVDKEGKVVNPADFPVEPDGKTPFMAFLWVAGGTIVLVVGIKLDEIIVKPVSA